MLIGFAKALKKMAGFRPDLGICANKKLIVHDFGNILYCDIPAYVLHDYRRRLHTLFYVRGDLQDILLHGQWNCIRIQKAAPA